MSQETSKPPTDTEENQLNEDGLFPLPVRGDTFEIAFYTAILAYVVYLFMTSRQFSGDDRLFPTIVIIPTVLLILSQIVLLRYPGVKERLSGGDSEANEVQKMLQESKNSQAGRSTGERQKFEILVLGWVIVLPIFVYLFGFATALPIYIFAFGWFFTRSVKMALLLSIGFSVGTYLLFIGVLGLVPYDGIIGIPGPLDYIPRLTLF